MNFKVGNIVKALKPMWTRHSSGEFMQHYLGGLCRRADAHNIFFMVNGLSVCILYMLDSLKKQ